LKLAEATTVPRRLRPAIILSVAIPRVLYNIYDLGLIIKLNQAVYKVTDFNASDASHLTNTTCSLRHHRHSASNTDL